MRLAVQPLTVSDINRIHGWALDVLEQVGVDFRDEQALEMFRHRGARVEGSRVFLPAHLVEAALETVPRSFSLLGRNPSRRVTIGGNGPVLAAASGAVYVVTGEGERRPAKAGDCIRLVKLVQGSPCVQVSCGGMVVPWDVPVDQRYAFMMLCSLWFSDKPVHGFADGAHAARDSIEMARLAMGIEEDWGRPEGAKFVIATVNPTSPLRYDRESIQGLIEFARACQPVVLASCGMAGSTSPVTLSGTLVLTHAEILAGLVFVQLIGPGTPVVYGNVSCPCDMLTMKPALGRAEMPLLTAAAAQLGHWLGLPFRGGGSLTDSTGLDVRAGYESMLNLLVTAAAGADFVLQALGVLDSFASISYEKFMLDEELFSVVLRLLKGFNLEEGRAGPDLIREGIEAGHFLMAESTCRYLREELWIPRYRSRSREGLADELRQAWESRLQDWACQPLDEDCHEALLAYYRSRYGTTPEWFATGGPRSEGSK